MARRVHQRVGARASLFFLHEIAFTAKRVLRAHFMLLSHGSEARCLFGPPWIRFVNEALLNGAERRGRLSILG